MSKSETLPVGWECALLGDVLPLKYGKARSAEHGLVFANTPVIGSSGVIDTYSRALTEKSALVVGRKGNVGSVYFSPGRCWPIDTVYYVEATPSANLRFFYYLLQHLQLGKLDRSTAVPGLSRDDYNAALVKIPGYREQSKIVDKVEELFSDLDKSIESLDIAQKQLKVYRQSLFKSAFEGRLTETWRRENKNILRTAKQQHDFIRQERSVLSSQIKSRQAKLFKDVQLRAEEVLIDLADLPDGWTWIHVGHISTGPSYGTSAKSSKEGNCPVLRMGNIQNCEFDWSDLVYTSDKEEIEKYKLARGDVLFNRTNSPELVGKTAIFESDRDAIFAGYLVRLNHINTLVDSNYLNFFLNSPIARLYGNKVKTDGVNQSNINAEKLCFYPFPFCSLEEQQEVSRILKAKMSEINKIEEVLHLELRRAENLRQSILKQALEGKLVPQDPKEEPASVLLERLKTELHGANASKKIKKGRKKK